MVTGPWDPGRGRFLASDADRERAVDVLKTAFVRGLLTKDELGTRTGQALTARTYAELAVITTILSARPAGSRAPARTARERVNKKVVALSACGIVLLPALGAAFFTFYGGFLVIFLFTFIGTVISSKPPVPRKSGPPSMSSRLRLAAGISRHPVVSGIIDGVASIDIEVLARTAYDAYRRSHKGSVPRWDELSATDQQGWRAAVSAVGSQGEATLTDAGPTPSLVVKADGQTQVFSTDFTAGRQGSLSVGDDHASNHHARFQFAHGSWYVEDLDSTNGTWLNNRRMFSAQRLKKGDKIRIGRTTIVVVSTGA